MQLLWNCHQINVTDDKLTLIQVMAWSHQATSHYLSAGEKRRTRRTFPMARRKCLMGNFTYLYRIYKAHQTNVWWTMKVFRLHCYLNQCWPRSMSPTRRMVSLGHNELTLTYHTNQDTYHKTHCGLVIWAHRTWSSLVIGSGNTLAPVQCQAITQTHLSITFMPNSLVFPLFHEGWLAPLCLVPHTGGC